MGRPRGSKSEGTPQRSIKECVDYVSAAYENAGDKVMSFSEMSKYMGLPAGSARAAGGALIKYGMITVDKKAGIWSLTDLGKRVARKEGTAIKEAFERISIFKDLSSEFWEKSATPGAVEKYIRSRYKKGDYAIKIAQEFLGVKEFIQSKIIETPSFKENGMLSSDMCVISRKVGQLFPILSREKGIEIIDELIKSTNEKKLFKFSGFLEGLKSGIENIDEDHFFDEMQRISENAINIFETEAGLKPKKSEKTKE